jgi:Flp pilus assembly protein TadD
VAEPVAPPAGPAQPVTANTPPAVPAAGVRDWPRDPELKRAVKLVNDLNSIREDFLLAEEIARKVVDKSPADAEAVTILAHVESMILARNFDFTAERTAVARRFCERAVQLAPNDPVALAALGIFLTQRGGDNARAEELLRRASLLAPDDSRIARNLALVISRQGGGAGTAESIRRYEEIATRFPHDPLAHYDLSIRYRDSGRYAEAERELDATIALAPVANAIDWKARFALMRGDLPATRQWLDRVPARLQGEERAVLTRVTYALFSGDTAYGLQSLNRFAETWFYDISNYTGPRSLLLAALRGREDKPELAHTLYEAALTEIHRYREEHPSDPGTQTTEAWALLGLGRVEEARAANTVALAGAARPFRYFPPGLWWFGAIPRTLLVGDRAAVLTQIREALQEPFTREPLRLRLQLDPRLASFRDDPEITALLADPKAGATPVAPGPAPDWPKDPDLKRAMRLIDSPEAITSDVVLAEDMVKAVLAARPTDTEATLAMGRVQVYYLVRGFDRSEERFATAKRFAERAMALSPDDPEAMVVMATYLYRRGVELPQAAKLLRAAIALRPANPFYYRMLDNVLSITPGVGDAEVIASARVTAERFPSDALVQYELARHYRDAGMLEEAERYFDIAIKFGPVANAIIARARLMLMAHGDAAGMKTLLDQLPERYRATDRAVFSQFGYALATQQPQLGLDALQVLPEPWMIDFDYTGPTALLAGELLLLQGKTELARLRFTDALAELGRHKADFSRNFSTTWLETWLLMRLGRLDEARQRNDAFFPELTRPFRLYLGTNWWFNPINLNLLLGDRAKAMALMRDGLGFPEGRTVLCNAFRFDPRMAPFRDDPEIKALLAEPEAKK